MEKAGASGARLLFLLALAAPLRFAAGADVLGDAALTPPLAALPAGAQEASYRDQLRAKARVTRLWEERPWRLLLHARSGWLGTRSEAAGPDFFLSPRGRRDIGAELEATLDGFFLAAPPTDPDAHPQCRFPARYAWLKGRLGFDGARLTERPCPRFEAWRAGLDPRSASLVFAAAYLNSPASMYGHTFLRLDRASEGALTPLLQYTLNYSAETDETNGIVFALRGLLGGYAGKFTVMPYYMKVQEYSNMESRDLWEYPLDLTPAELDLLARHAWELGQTWFPYYFLNRNCSFQLLPFLEAAAPRLQVAPARPLWVIPADTVRLLRLQGAAAAPMFRPSQRTTMRVRRARLAPEERRLAGDLVTGPMDTAFAALDSLSPDRQAAVADAAEDYLLYKWGPSPVRDEEAARREHALLVKRGRIAAPPEPVGLPSGDPGWEPPESGHRTFRAGLARGWAKGTAFEEFSLRAALHDPLDAPEGYAAGAQLEMGHLRLRRDESADRFFVQELTVFRILSLSPWDPWDRRTSWKAETGFEALEDGRRPPWETTVYRFRTGAGAAAEAAVAGRETFYIFADADAAVGGALRRGFRLGGGPTAGIVAAMGGRWRAWFEGSFFGYALGDGRPEPRLRLGQQVDLARDLTLRLALERRRDRREIFAGLNLHL